MDAIYAIVPYEVLVFLGIGGFLCTSVTALLAVRYKKARVLPFFLGVASMLLTLGIVSSMVAVPKILSTDPSQQGQLDAGSPQLSVAFSTPVDLAALSVHTFPEMETSVTPQGYLGNTVPFGRQITIKGNLTIPSGERVKIYISNIRGPLTRGYGSEKLLELATPDPKIIAIHPPEATREMQPLQSFTFKLSQPSGKENEWSIRSHPIALLSLQQIDATTFHIEPRLPLEQSTHYTWTFTETPVVRNIRTGETVKRLDPVIKTVIQFSTVSPPFITSFAPQGMAVNPDAEIAVQFTQPMNTQSAHEHLTITPQTVPTLTWDASESGVRISHPILEKDTTYTVAFTKGTMTAKGGAFTTASSFQFHTAGPLRVASITPDNQSKQVSIATPITIVFDQDIPQSLANSVIISPPIAGKQEVAGTTLHILPDTILLYDTRYTITIPPGVSGLYGLPSTSTQVFSFTTQPDQTVLAVPFFEQESPFTCNIAAARMLLAFRGKNISESSLIGIIGSGGKRGSGNPNKGYIDDYGTYWDAVAKGISAYRPNRIISGGSLSDITEELIKGNPVMTWGQNGWSDPHDLSWTTPDGTRINAINGMHSTVVRGFSGPKEHPTAILLNDPWRGQYEISVNEFMRRWGYLKMALVVD